MTFFESWSSDAALVREALADRPEAFEALVLRYQRKAHAIARAIGVRPDSLDDVVQESFLQAFCGLRKLASPASFGPWFLSIVRNLSRKHLERSPKGVPFEEPREPAASAEEPQFEAEDVREVGERLRREVQKLPEGFREAVFLYYYEGLSTRRVAEALEISPSAVKVRLFRARDLLRERLWRSLEDSLRETLPSPRLWKRKGRRLALFLLSAVSVHAGASAASAASATAAVSAGWLEKAAIGVLLMSAKKITIALSISILLVAGGTLLLLNHSSGNRPEGDRGLAASRPAGPGADAVPAPGPAGKARPSPAKAAPAGGPRTGIAGTVFREGSPAPAGIQVAAILDGRWGQVARAETREDGTYLLGELGAGRYRPWAWSGTWSTQRPAADEAVEVRAGEVTKGVDLTLVPGGILRGLVVERSTGDAIPGASVECFFQTALADPEGRFALEGLRAGTALLTVRAKGFAREMKDVEVALGDESSVTIGLVPGGEIEGTVTDASGKPVAAIGLEADWGGTTSARTDAAGRYRIEGIPLTSKDIAVTASRDGLGAVKAVVPGFPEGGSNVVLDLRLEEGFTLKGQVVDAGGRPVPGAEVTFGGAGARGMRKADGEGRFVLDGATEGIGSLTARKKGFSPGTISLANLSPEERGVLRIVLPQGHSVAGRVTDSKGDPVEGAHVNAFSPSGASSSTTDAEGRFRLEDLPAVIRSISAAKEGFAEGEIQDVKADRDDLAIILEEAGQIVGIAVEKDGGSPVQGIRAKLEIKDWKGIPGSLFSTAWISFDLPDGGFKFRQSLKAGQISKVLVSADEYSQAELDGVEAWGWSETRDPIRVEMEKGGIIKGRVVDGTTGAALEGVKLIHVADRGEGPRDGARRSWPSREAGGPESGGRSAVTDGQGSFELKGIPSAGGALFLEKQGYARRVIPSIRSGFDLQVFELTPAAAIEGTVRTEGGKPISEARVEVAVRGLVFPEVKSDKDGRYKIEDLPAGKAEVSMDRRSADPYIRPKPQIAVLTAGETSVADIVESGGAIAGRVTTRNKKPILEARVLVKSRTDIREPMYALSVDGEGRFRIGGVPPGIYDVRVELPGRSADLPDEARKKVVVEADEAVCDFSLNASNPICIVAGRVVDRVTGSAVLGARVKLLEKGKGHFVCGDLKMSESDWLPHGEAATGSEESFRIEVFTAGSYLLTASLAEDAAGQGWLGPLELRPSKDPIQVTIPVGGPSTLSLTVVDARSKAAMAGSAIEFHPAGGVPVEYQAKADASGKAVLPGLPPGQYGLEVRSEGYSLHKEVIAIAEGTIARTVSLEPASWIRVSLARKPREKSECYVTATAVAGGDPGWDYLSKDGTRPAACAAFKPGASGEGSVRLSARPGRYEIRFEVMEGGSNLASVHEETLGVEVPEGGEAAVKIALPGE